MRDRRGKSFQSILGRVTVATALTALVAGCSGQKTANNRDTMTQRQKDSVLAQSGIPGAQGVGNALAAADSAKARQARLDSASKP